MGASVRNSARQVGHQVAKYIMNTGLPDAVRSASATGVPSDLSMVTPVGFLQRSSPRAQLERPSGPPQVPRSPELAYRSRQPSRSTSVPARPWAIQVPLSRSWVSVARALELQ
jgi:hypothetical protein